MGNVYRKSEILQELMEDTIRKYPEMEKLEGVRIVCLIKDKPNRQKNRTIYADCTKVTDKLKAVADCDFIITFYADALDLDTEKQERLIYHELLHVGYDPDDEKYFIRPHDLEDFRAVIEKWEWTGSMITKEQRRQERREIWRDQMLIASKDRNQIINMSEAMVAFVNAESRIIVASAGGKNMVLDGYNARTDALTAMRILTERLRLANSETRIVFMPTDEEVRTYRVSLGEDKSGVHHYADGGKTKRRGRIMITGGARWDPQRNTRKQS